jgi:hypothetical protein
MELSLFMHTYICKNMFVNFFLVIQENSPTIYVVMLSLYYSRRINLSLIDNFCYRIVLFYIIKLLRIGFIYAQYGKILSIDLKSRLIILPY